MSDVKFPPPQALRAPRLALLLSQNDYTILVVNIQYHVVSRLSDSPEIVLNIIKSSYIINTNFKFEVDYLKPMMIQKKENLMSPL